MKKLLSVGCSFLTRRLYGTILPQVEVVANKLNYDLENKAHQGRGNSYIINRLISSLHENTYDLVIIGWTSPFRWDFLNPRGKPFAIKLQNLIEMKELWEQTCDTNQTQFFRWSNDVYLVSEMLRLKKIPFVMFNSLPCWTDGNTWIHEYIKSMPEFLFYDKNQLDDGIQFKEYISKDNLHPNQTGNDKWAGFLIDKIKELYI